MSLDEAAFQQGLAKVTDLVRQRFSDLANLPTTPLSTTIADTIAALPRTLPQHGKGLPATTDYLLDTLLPGILQGQSGPRYFGFVTGGVTPAAQLADIVSSSYDENAAVTLPGVTAATAIESRTLEMVLDLLDIPRDRYTGRTITTGATSSNVLGMGESMDEEWMVVAHAGSMRKGLPVLDVAPLTKRILVRSGWSAQLTDLTQSSHRRPLHPPTFLYSQSRWAGWNRCRTESRTDSPSL